MEHYTHIAWDFNGTLLNDLDASLFSANALLKSHDLPPLADLSAYRESFGFPIVDYYRRLGFDFDQTPYDALAEEWVPLYLQAAKNAAVYPAVPALLDAIRTRGLSQLILSATHIEMLEKQITQLGIRSYFQELLGLDNIHAYGKAHIAEAWRMKNQGARTLLIGDTEHDLDAARAMGADCILIANGHRPLHALKRCGAMAVFPDHEALLQALPQVLGASAL